MNLKYPAEAFAFGILLFSAGMKEAFTAGVLVILSVVFAEFIKNLLENVIPAWSLKACVLISTAAVTSSAFLLGFAFLGDSLAVETWVMTLAVGLLSAKCVLMNDLEGDYGEIFWESGICWGFWVLLAVLREFAGSGRIFGNMILEMEFQSKAFLEMTFAFLTAGLVLAFTNGVLKKKCGQTHSLFLVVLAALYAKPFTMESFGELAGLLWTIAVPIVLFISVKKTLKFARTGQAYRGLPVEMISMGVIYMILGIY